VAKGRLRELVIHGKCDQLLRLIDASEHKVRSLTLSASGSGASHSWQGLLPNQLALKLRKNTEYYGSPTRYPIATRGRGVDLLGETLEADSSLLEHGLNSMR